jgi:hypothetical protein
LKRTDKRFSYIEELHKPDGVDSVILLQSICQGYGPFIADTVSTKSAHKYILSVVADTIWVIDMISECICTMSIHYRMNRAIAHQSLRYCDRTGISNIVST